MIKTAHKIFSENRDEGVEYRKSILTVKNTNYVLNDEDVVLLQTLLHSKSDKCFVADVLGVVDAFPEVLAVKLMEAALEEHDVNACGQFINPILRVFGVDFVLDFIQQLPINSEASQINVLKLLFHTNSQVLVLNRPTDLTFKKWEKRKVYVRYVWDEKHLTYTLDSDTGENNEMSADEKKDYEVIHKRFHKSKSQIINKIIANPSSKIVSGYIRQLGLQD